MTIKTEQDLTDKFLALFGKQRAIRLPLENYKKFGPYAYSKAEKENIFRALLRPKGKKPPEGWIYPQRGEGT